MGLVWSHIDRIVVVEHCSSVDGRLVLELVGLVLDFGSCSCGMGLMDVGLGLHDRHLGNLGCSIARHKRHHQIDLRCHIDRRSCVVIELVDIVVEQLVEWAVVVLVERLANDRLWLGI